MNGYVKAGEAVTNRIIKGKKKCMGVFAHNFLFLLLCWVVTGVVSFAAWGVYVFLDFAFYFAGFHFEIFTAILAMLGVLPLYLGNVRVITYLIKGRKADILLLFEGYFNFRKLCVWVVAFVISQCSGWLVSLLVALFATDTFRFLPIARGDVLLVVSVVAEIATLYLFFINACKSVYFILGFSLSESARGNIEKSKKKYLRVGKYFKKYMLSHFYLLIILFFASKMPLYAYVPVFILFTGYLALSVASFGFGFGIKIKNIKTGGCKKI